MAKTRIIKTKYYIEDERVETLAEVPVEKRDSWQGNDTLNVVGRGTARKDGYDKVSGSARYTYDITLPNMVFAKILRSPHPHARIKMIDTKEAEKLKGVLYILTHKNAPKMPWFGDSYLFDTHIRYEGDEVACVAAVSEEIAGQALEMIRVAYETLPFVVTSEEGMGPAAPKLYDEGNILGGEPSRYSRGDVETGFNEADHVIEDTFTTQVVVHNPTEVHCSVANWNGGELTVWDSTQGIFSVRDALSRSLDIPANKIRVIKHYMGGGFGAKLACGKYTVMAALIARKTGRPVKITLDRKEMNLATGNRPDSLQKLKIGLKKTGEITALSHYSHGMSGAYPSGAGCSWPLRTIYKCPNVSTEEYSVFVNAGPGRPFRAPGHVQGVFALDSLMDEAAEKIGMDPLEFRLKNYAETDQVYNLQYTSKKLRECYAQGAEAIGWSRRRQLSASGDTAVKRGIGMASQIWWGGGGPPAHVILKVNWDGSAEVLCGSQDLGTGTYTILAQVVSEVLEIPVDHVRVILGDTATCPFAPSSGGSQTAPSITPAARDAAEQVKFKLMEAAAAVMETVPENLVYEKGTIRNREDADSGLNIGSIIRKMDERVLTTYGSREENREGYMINSFGAQFAEVEVNLLTGRIRVVKIVAAHDIGRTLNRTLLENQFEGGIIQGMSFALMENRTIDYNTGKVLTTNLYDYKMPTILDTPEIEVIIVSDGDPLISNTGVKGIGEPPIIPTAGAIANAVYNAIGVRIKTLPITPDVVLNALHA